MRALIQEIPELPSPEGLVEALGPNHGTVLLRSAMFDLPSARYSLVAARPMATFQSNGAQAWLQQGRQRQRLSGDPWAMLANLLQRFELRDEPDLPFPLGGCFGFWSYGLKHFVEPRLPRRVANDLALPDCHLGFYDSLVALDHLLGKAWIISTGLQPDGTISAAHARKQLDFWRRKLEAAVVPGATLHSAVGASHITSTLSRDQFISAVRTAQDYIRAGHIYQVNLSHRLSAPLPTTAWDFYLRLLAISPAPFSAWIDAGNFQVASSSPEQFLRMSGAQMQTRPIKGTRPRDADPTRDAQLMYELQTSPKELAELVMITDLLRNDLGRVCQYGSVHVPELAKLERYPQVQHLVSTVTGTLRPELSHMDALAACFPGGSITGAPKIRAMEIIEELEPVARGVYTGCIGYLGFNRESQLSIAIRTAVCHRQKIHFATGAGIVADSIPEAEYDETLDKARGFMAALNWPQPREVPCR